MRRWSLLKRARALDDGSGLIFPSPLRPGRPLSPMTLTKILRDRGLAEWATVHGFRSTFRDWCAETGKSRRLRLPTRFLTGDEAKVVKLRA